MRDPRRGDGRAGGRIAPPWYGQRLPPETSRDIAAPRATTPPRPAPARARAGAGAIGTGRGETTSVTELLDAGTAEGSTGPGRRERGKRRRETAEQVLAFLCQDPDLDRLRAAMPDLTDDALRRVFAAALAGDLGAKAAVSYRKGVTATRFARTHGLPDPDPKMHKGMVFRSLLSVMRPGRLLDLGAGKGNFSLIAAQLGWDVTAVDARTVRWPDADRVDPATAGMIRRIRWVQADVRAFPIATGDFDVVCILGLLHHLELPDQVDLLRRCAGTPLILDVRIAKAAPDTDGPYAGMLIREHGETREERDAVPTASWGNPTSFQHTEESLLRLLADCGYAKTFMMRPPHRSDYTFYLALPRPAALSTPLDAADEDDGDDAAPTTAEPRAKQPRRARKAPAAASAKDADGRD